MYRDRTQDRRTRCCSSAHRLEGEEGGDPRGPEALAVALALAVICRVAARLPRGSAGRRALAQACIPLRDFEVASGARAA